MWISLKTLKNWKKGFSRIKKKLKWWWMVYVFKLLKLLWLFHFTKKHIQLKSTEVVSEVPQRILNYWPDPVPREENGRFNYSLFILYKNITLKFKLEMKQWCHCPWNKRKIIIHVLTLSEYGWHTVREIETLQDLQYKTKYNCK